MKTIAAITLVASAAAAAQVERVEIVGAGPAPERQVATVDQSRPAPVALLGAVGLASAAAAAGGVGWRRWSRLDDAERAFLLLSLRLGVRHKERQRLRAEARASGVTPIAALASQPR